MVEFQRLVTLLGEFVTFPTVSSDQRYAPDMQKAGSWLGSKFEELLGATAARLAVYLAVWEGMCYCNFCVLPTFFLDLFVVLPTFFLLEELLFHSESDDRVIFGQARIFPGGVIARCGWDARKPLVIMHRGSRDSRWRILSQLWIFRSQQRSKVVPF